MTVSSSYGLQSPNTTNWPYPDGAARMLEGEQVEKPGWENVGTNLGDCHEAKRQRRAP